MSERSLAEIIGWERRENAERTVWYDPPEPDPRRRHEWQPVTPQPTVDDLLAWLREQRYNVLCTSWVEGGAVVSLISVTKPEARYPAATLLAALESAVRAVDAATESGRAAQIDA